MKTHLKILPALLLILCCKQPEQKHTNPESHYKPTAKTEQLAAFIQSTLDTTQIIPAISVVVVDENGPLYLEGFGNADVEKKIKTDVKTQFYIASCTKSFNGLLAHILESEGKINLEKEIVVYQPFKNFKDKSVFEGVTLRQLLNHTSGLENPYLTYPLAYSGEYDKSEITQLIENETRKSTTGNTFSYTNLGYYFFDVILEQELGQNWKTLLREKVFVPLKMENTTAFLSEARNEEMALPHLGAFKDSIGIAQLQKTDKTMHAAGGLVSNVTDISNFLSFYINQDSISNRSLYDGEVIKSSYFKTADTQNSIGKAWEAHGYGSGWLLGKLNDEDLVLHYGAYEGYRAHISFIPEHKLGVAVFINHEFAMPVINNIARYAYNLYLEDEPELDAMKEEALKEMADLLNRYQNYIVEREKKLERGSWMASEYKEDYTGLYQSKYLGTIDVSLENGRLWVKAGNMKSMAIPSSNDNCVWVKLTTQAGEDLCFEKEADKVQFLEYREQRFAKQ